MGLAAENAITKTSKHTHLIEATKQILTYYTAF